MVSIDVITPKFENLLTSEESPTIALLVNSVCHPRLRNDRRL